MKRSLPSTSCIVIDRTARAARLAGTLASLLAMLWSVPAFADESAEISKLMAAAQYPAAMAKVNAALAQRPRDAQLRFFKGLILAGENKSGEAIAVFTKLTQDFPELPAPYNNLAVLLAANGQYDKARVALESALRTHPIYATAHENLGDMYAKLASQAYDKALQIDSGKAGANSKLALVQTLVSAPVNGAIRRAPPPVAAPAAAVAVASQPASAAASAKAKAVPASAPVAKAEAASKPPAKGDPDRDEILKAVAAWAKAWSAKDVKTYLGSYSSNFQTPKGVSRRAWADERRARIEGKGHITVTVEAPQVTIDGNAATVKFRQQYVSNRLSSSSRKTLVLEKQGNKWQIKQERTGS
jgi:tetratricopeptide (TPR) repeat protein